MTLEPFGRVHVETFEVEYFLRPLFLSKEQLYTNRTCKDDASVREILFDLPVDVATWLHRAGAWEGPVDEA